MSMKAASMILALALTAGAALAAFTCLAQDTTPTQVNITFSNADLADPTKAADIHDKLLKAAQFVCESEGEGPAWRQADDRACETDAVQTAERHLKALQIAANDRAKMQADSGRDGRPEHIVLAVR